VNKIKKIKNHELIAILVRVGGNRRKMFSCKKIQAPKREI